MISPQSVVQTVSRRRMLRRLIGTGAALGASAVLMTTRTAWAAPTVHQVDIRQFVYEPAVLEVRPGDKVVWTNHDIAPHTATAEDYGWDTGELGKGESAEIVVTEDMPTGYFCVFHPHMKAKLVLLSS